MMRNYTKRLAYLEARHTPDLPVMVIELDDREVQILSMNGIETPAAAATRAEYTRAGYLVLPGYR